MFGSKFLIDQIIEFGDKNPNLEFLTFYYDSLQEVSKLVEKTTGYDVLLFTGPVPYYLSLTTIKKKGLPATYISMDEFVVILSLYQVRQQFHQQAERLSFDIEDTNYVESVFKELQLPMDSIFIKEYRPEIEKSAVEFDVEKIVQHHYALWQQQKIDLVLTTISTVYDRLTALGVNCYRMLIPEKKMKDKLDDAFKQGELMRTRKSQIAVGIVSIDAYEMTVRELGKNEVTSNVLELHQLLLQFGHDIDATVTYLGEEKFIIYSTKGALNYVTNQFQNLPIVKKISELLHINVSVGFGIGFTANEAEENAQTALHYAKEIKGQSSCFIVTDEKLVVGPLNDNAKNFHLRTDDSLVLSIAKLTGISVKNVSKILMFKEVRGSKQFTSIELSEHLQLTRRSSDRILKRLLDNKLVEVVGEEQPYQKGRPRAVYSFNLEYVQ